jgi:glutamate/tyrosine decarboxylase-like PLP-dependent enzyme
VFQNPNAVYLNTASSETTASSDRTIPSPLNIGIENSRRFRALPVYSTLAAYGRAGYRDMLERQIAMARSIAKLLLDSATYELLPPALNNRVPDEDRLQQIYMVVLFRARDDQLNGDLVKRINASRQIYVSGTQWDGRPAARFAVASWQIDVKRDLPVVEKILSEVAG